MSRDRRHRASYDAQGDIVIRGDDMQEGTWISLHDYEKDTLDEVTEMPERTLPHAELIGWTVEEDAPVLTEMQTPTMAVDETAQTVPVRSHVSKISTVTRRSMREITRQYADTMFATGPMLQELQSSARSSLSSMRRFLRQPVWIPGRGHKTKRYNRTTLFLIDTIRFGATFAGIFAVLFIALNYQSFWLIASARVEDVLQGPSVSSPMQTQNGAGTVPDMLTGIASQGTDASGLLAYLPLVGPPENQLVIPKLHLTVPLVEPSYEALLRQDWTKVEEDIQTALQNGVVHYPGTARPGQAGNFFVTGHSSYYSWAKGDYKSVFARLNELKAGDEYWVYFGGDKHRYIVRSSKEVSPSDVSVLDQPPEARISTLMTCTPVGTSLRRLIVRAEEVDPQTGHPLKVGEKADTPLPSAPPLEALPM